MNYELAKELKEAGFPQKDMPAYDSEGYIHRTEEEKDKWVYLPTLSELIEECGDSFFDLNLKPKDKSWRASSIYFTNGMITTNGSTPEEAVARLYIALNKK